MTGSRCHRRKMMGRGAEGGCGTEEKSCPISRVSSRFPANELSSRRDEAEVDIDFYAQARKALSERSPFDSDDALVSSIPTLPSGLAEFLSKHSDSRKKHKKSQLEASAKSSVHVPVVQSHGWNVWAETEEYFRQVTLLDIENLFSVSSFASSAPPSCFSIPLVRNGTVTNAVSAATVTVANVVEVVVQEEKEEATVVVQEEATVVVKEEKEEEEQFMEIDSGGVDVLPQQEMGCSLTQSLPSTTGSEWLLGSRNKILLTSERPSKKRKLLGSDAGLERLVVARPSEGHGLPVCHFCCLGDTGEQTNRILVCDSCTVAVHQKCYGVQESPVGSWLCSWCKQRNDVETGLGGKEAGSDGSDFLSRPCLLCPKQGGALKPVDSKNGESVKFAHLFCCQWIPEVYVEDTGTMEPILNFEGIKETRRKLVCYLCKVKYGACIRCSHGTCRTSFHPLCAREAKHRMEIWGKIGCDNVELRAFCSKHSELQDTSSTQQSGNDLSVAVDCNSSLAKHSPLMLPVNKPHKLKLGRKNGEKNTAHVKTDDSTSDKLGNSEISEQGLLDTRPNARLGSECGDAQQLISMEALERSNNGDINSSDSLDFVLILKKLIDRGKAIVRDVALDIGVSPDSLAAIIAGDRPVLFPDLRSKIVKWLRNHACVGSSQKNLKLISKPAISSRAEIAEPDGPNAIAVAASDNPDSVSIKSVPPRKRTKSNIRILKDNKVVCSSKETFVQQSDNGIVIDEINEHPLAVSEDLKDGSSNEFLSLDGDCRFKDPDAMEKILTETSGCQELDPSIRQSPISEGNPAKLANCNISDSGQAEGATASVQNTLTDPTGEHPLCSVLGSPITPSFPSGEVASSSYIHPFIHKKLIQMQNDVLSKNLICPREKEMSAVEASSAASVCCNHQDRLSPCIDANHTSDAVNIDQLVKARNMGVLKLSPEDEVEGKLIYFQNRLLDNAVLSKRYCDNLICRVVKNLPLEIDAVRKKRWDAVLVNQYLCELREAKKQGRKQRRHKEAQAVLAAATAAAAASSRNSSFRKDVHDEVAHHESQLKLNTASGRVGSYSQLMPRAKETLSRLAVARVSSEKHSDSCLLTSDFSKEHPRSCDVCRRSEAILNPISVCCNCKVAVHLGCYRSVKDTTGSWYCELCEELFLSRTPRAQAVNSREKPCFVAQCGLCGGTNGAFRKSADGQWVHAFCAEWVLASFRRGQLNLIEGMETISKERDVCYICRHKLGVCIKCNYGHCQSTFHPSCARNAGLYMHVKTGGGKLQHKAYCEKHSLEQREKAETLHHGAEELKSIKQIRVELERLRLLCERIIKREKVKRELVFCSHDILASKRDSVALSVLVRSPFFQPEVSSESATTSLKGHVYDNKSCSEAIQRSDDITMDSTVSGTLPVPMDIDQKTDDSSSSQGPGTRKPTDRAPFSGKQLSHRPASVASRNLTDDGERRSKSRKHTETFQKELVMTSDQASVQNQRLPKGFAYVPIGYLSKEKQVIDQKKKGEASHP